MGQINHNILVEYWLFLVNKPCMSPFESFEAAVAAASGQTAFGRIIGVSQQRIWNWLQARKALPADYVLAAEAGTGISRHLLRPDIYPTPTEAE